nr:vegetative cell wall protein gp1-like [Lolium perenne]
MPLEWSWGLLPLSSTNPPSAEACERFPRIAAEARGPCRKRPLDKVDPDPYVVGNKHKMGRTHTSRPDLPSASANRQVVEHAAPLQAEVGREYLDNLTSRDRKNKAPASKAGPSEDPPAKRSKKGTVKRYRSQIPVAAGHALSLTKSASGMRPETSEEAARASPPPQPSPKKKKKATASPSKTVPETSAPANCPPAKETPEAPAPPKDVPAPTTAAPTGQPAADKPPQPEGAKLSAQQLAAVVTAATAPSSGSRSLVLHAGRAAVAAGNKASTQLGRITELNRGEANVGHLLEYAEKWNQADFSPATRGLANAHRSVGLGPFLV